MKVNEGKILLLLSGILSGIVITSFLVNASVSPTTFLTYAEYLNMKNQENKLTTEIKGLKKEMIELDKKLDKYNESSEKNKGVEESMKKELNDLHMFYGSSSVHGSGIRITVTDRAVTFDEFDRLNQLNLVHNYDLLYLVNELNNAGAEAVAINKERVVSNSSISCVGLTVMVNGNYIAAPFVVTAIGDPEALKYSLSLQESYFKYLAEDRRLNIKIETVDDIVIQGVEIGNDYKDLTPDNK